MVRIRLVYKKLPNCLPKWLRYHFAFPAETNESSCCSTSLPVFDHQPSDAVRVLEFSHSDRCVLISHCLNLKFSNDQMLSLFSYSYLFSIYIYLFWRYDAYYLKKKKAKYNSLKKSSKMCSLWKSLAKED